MKNFSAIFLLESIKSCCMLSFGKQHIILQGWIKKYIWWILNVTNLTYLDLNQYLLEHPGLNMVCLCILNFDKVKRFESSHLLFRSHIETSEWWLSPLFCFSLKICCWNSAIFEAFVFFPINSLKKVVNTITEWLTITKCKVSG